ncbi:MAG TPA: transcriptional regulator [Verrucomicrobiae bacterium]|nr:transcriptional regulator [Verrucomicrobiae bacterium]
MAKPGKKYSQAGRVHETIRLIESRHGITLEELAEETGVNRRTVHRDLAAIQEAGYPLVSEWDNGRKLYRFLTRFKDVPPVHFTLRELMTLSLLRSQADLLKGTPFRDDMESIFLKVNSVLPPRFAAHLERIAKVSLPILQGTRDYARSAHLIDLLRDALLRQYRVELSYDARGNGNEQEYLVDPYTLLLYKGGLYLLGHAHNRGSLRTFALERVTGVRPTRERFEIPADFDAGGRLEKAFGIVDEEAFAVRIRFAPAVAHAVRDRTWHATQEVAEQPDGSIILSFRAGGRMEIVSWVLSYGRLAELLEPAELREEIALHAREMADAYREAAAIDKAAGATL